MASLGLGFVAEPAMAHLLEPVAHFVHLPAGVAVTVVRSSSALSIVVFLHLVIGEMVPKNLAMADPERTLRWLALPNRAYLFVFRPVVRALNARPTSAPGVRRASRATSWATCPTAEELTVMLAASRDEGLIEDFAHELLTGVLDFGERAVTSVMVPRAEIVLDHRPDAPCAEAESLVVESGHSRLLVQGADGARRRPRVRPRQGPADARAGAWPTAPLPLRLVRRMLVVPAERTLEDLLLSMRHARSTCAVVTDADGRTVGLVTLEDLLEELVGDILDESD